MGSGRVEREPAAAEAGGGIEPEPGGTDGFASLATTGGIVGIDRGVIGGIEGGGIDRGVIDRGGIEGGGIEGGGIEGGGIDRGVAGGIEGGGCIDDGGGIDRGVAGAGEELVGAGGIERVFVGRGGTSGAGGGRGAGCGLAMGVRCGGRGTAFLGGSSSLAIRQRRVQDFAPVR